ncbi:MAG: lycopene cyclase [Bacteroidetes bacterium]|nr:lycopene cyclase [Bacteroidota bacterium]
MAHYDYIIAGSGCAGLSLLMRMIENENFSDKKILLVDRSPKNNNDRTWCFWEKENGFFEDIVFKKWDKLWFHADGYSSLKHIFPYKYKMIRGIDFYRHCFSRIARQKNITAIYQPVERIFNDDLEPCMIMGGEKVTAKYIFNSVQFEKPVLKRKEFYLLQHFAGWVIETKEGVFIPGEATLMDFTVTQKNGNAFAYILPFSSTKALIEYTLITDTLLQQKQYEEALYEYIDKKFSSLNYTIIEKEFGFIPMTNHVFPGAENNIIHIGTAGGQTKASSGYTFQFIQKQSEIIVESLSENKALSLVARKSRFDFYDSILLNVLATRKLSAEKIFQHLFRKNNITDIFNFLDNDSSLLQELKIIGSLPVLPFLRAGVQQLF